MNGQRTVLDGSKAKGARKRNFSLVASDGDENGYDPEEQAETDDIVPAIAAPNTTDFFTNGGGPPLKRRLKEENYIAQGGAVANFISQKYMPTFHRPPGNTSTSNEPSLEILEQPRARGFRFRYPCEGPCHGELRGENNEPRLKTYPAVKLHGVQTRARILVSLVCHDNPIRPHAHCLVGKNVQAGQCRVDVGKETDWTAQFPRLSILHIPKKNAARVLLERYALMKDPATGAWAPGCQQSQQQDLQLRRDSAGSSAEDAGAHHQDKSRYDDKMALELQLLPGAREQLAGGAAALAALDEEDRRQLEECAAEQARTMNLNVVRLCFQAFLPDENGAYTRCLEPKLSHPVYDTKASSSSALRICRLDRHSGSALGGDVIFMLCDRVQKDDITIRFFEERSTDHGSGKAFDNTAESSYQWEADGEFSVNDVHRQSAIVFKTPPYCISNITRPVKVWVALKRRSEEETGEPHPFTYLPPDACTCSCKGSGSGNVGNGSCSNPTPQAAQLSSPTAQLTKSISVPSMLSHVTANHQRVMPTSLISSMPSLNIASSAAPSNGVYYFYSGMPPGAMAMSPGAAAVPPVPTSPFTTPMQSLGMPFFQPMMAACHGSAPMMPAPMVSAPTIPIAPKPDVVAAGT